MTDTVFDGVQTWLTHPLVFPPPPPLFSFCFSIYLPPSPLTPPFPTSSSFHPSSPALIVLHLFIQSFMAASSSRRPISPPEYGFLLKLSLLFIICVDPHHISLTLGRWFSHWTTLLTRRITNPLRISHKHSDSQNDRVRAGGPTSLYYSADLLAAKMLHSILMLHNGVLGEMSSFQTHLSCILEYCISVTCCRVSDYFNVRQSAMEII